MQEPRVIISGGGTGGHVFPAIAIANAIKSLRPDAKIHFIGAIGRMEMEKVPEAGYTIEGLPISGLQRSLSARNLSFPFKLIRSLLRSRRILKEFNAQVAVGVGGYASGPLLYMASRKGIPCLIQEQNSYPGITNKLLAKRVKRICVAYDQMERFFPKEKILFTGNPVRNEVVNLEGKAARAYEHFNLNPEKKTILVVGGSLGARSINHCIAKLLDNFAEGELQLIWQCGRAYYSEGAKLSEAYRERGIRCFQFIKEMDYAYAAADIVISRAGAIAVSELCCVAKPVILVPSPNVAEDHQTKNAMALVNQEAALMVKDSDLDQKLWPALSEIVKDAQKQQRLSEKIQLLAKTNAADIIAKEVLSFIR